MPGDALSQIRARGHIGIRLGLGRMRALLGRLGDPQVELHGVLIAGTNGKGSTAAMIAAMLKSAGMRASQSPSPYLGSYRERIVIDGEPITAADLDGVLQEVLRASEPGEARHGPATEFELLTAAAFLWSSRQHVDVAVIEVGLGGRLDATNTWDADVATITNVALDHQQFLGNTIEAVAREKAAIVKRAGYAVTGATGPALDVIRRRARRLEVPLRVSSQPSVAAHGRSGQTIYHERLGALHLPLLGRHQAHNAAVALDTIDVLRGVGVVAISDEAMRDGLATTRWPGRIELLEVAGTTIILDGAHNPAGALALATTVQELRGALPSGRATLLVGIMEDKDVPAVLSALATSELLRTAQFVASGVPEETRSLAAAAVAAAWAETARTSPADAALDDADAALDRALALAAAADGPLVIAGSLYLIGHVRARLVPAADHD